MRADLIRQSLSQQHSISEAERAAPAPALRVQGLGSLQIMESGLTKLPRKRGEWKPEPAELGGKSAVCWGGRWGVA